MRRPDVFTLDYSHPLAQGLVFAGLCGRSSGYDDFSLRSKIADVYAPIKWTFADELGRVGIDTDGGSASLLTLPFSTGACPITADMASSITVSLFCRKMSSISSTGPINCKGGYNNNGFTIWLGNTDTTSASVRVQGISKNFGVLPIGELAHLCFTYDGAILSLYRDGNLVLSSAATANAYGATGLLIGRIYSGVACDAHIFDAVIYNRPLPPSEIALLADRTDSMLGGLIVEERPVLYFDIGGSTVDALTASNLTISAPVLGAPTLGQAHALIVSGITVEGPVLGSPALGQVHALSAAPLVAGSPTLGSPTFAQIHALTAPGITVEGPVLGAPVLAQIHALTAPNFTASSPVLGAPAVGQVHALTANNLTVSSPVLGTPSLTENENPVDALIADNLVAGSPVLGTPAIGQAHALTAQNFATGSPVLGVPSLAENAPNADNLTANSLSVGSPVLGTPALTQVHVLGSDGLVTGSPVLGQPAITQIHVLEALGLMVGAPVLGAPELNKTTIDLDITANLSSVGLDVMYLDSIGTFTAQLTSSGCKLVTLRSVGNFEVAEREE